MSTTHKKKIDHYEVAFHLAAGDYKNMWQIKCPDGSIKYRDPATTQLKMVKATFRNRPNEARKIQEGGNKTRCAWVQADDVQIRDLTKCEEVPPTDWTYVRFNPNVSEYWHINDRIMDYENVDVAYTHGRGVYI